MKPGLAVIIMCVAAPALADGRGAQIAKKAQGDLPPTNQDGEYGYDAVVEVPGASADDLFSRARAWVARAYVSAQDVIQLQDEKARRVIVKGTTSATYGMITMAIRHTLTIEVKESRYRYRAGELVLVTGAGEEYPLTKKKMLIQTARKLEAIIEGLKAAMASSVDEDW